MRNPLSIADVLIIGAGPAGLALSYHLSRMDLAHTLFEAGRVGESWRSRRWESLRLVAPNWHLQLPGMPYAGADPDGFLCRDEVVAYIEAYAQSISAPVRANVRVHSISAQPGSDKLLVQSELGSLSATQVVVATGAYSAPRLPDCATQLSPRLVQLHSMDYQRPAQLPPGAVLVVGSGESGCQIADELRNAGREVWLAVGRGGWLPRRYRGHDCVAWVTVLGGFEQTVAELPGGDPRNAPPGPQLTGQGGGRDLNLHTLARAGVRLVGHLEGAAGELLRFAPDLQQQIAAADAVATGFCQAVDAYVAQQGIDAPQEPPPVYADAIAAGAPTELDLARAKISSVIWATGYRPDYSWIKLPVFAADGYPIHTRGVTRWPGLAFLGLEWQHNAKSHVFQGLGDDAAHLAALIGAQREGRQ